MQPAQQSRPSTARSFRPRPSSRTANRCAHQPSSGWWKRPDMGIRPKNPTAANECGCVAFRRRLQRRWLANVCDPALHLWAVSVKAGPASPSRLFVLVAAQARATRNGFDGIRVYTRSREPRPCQGKSEKQSMSDPCRV